MGAHESVLPCALVTFGVEKALPFALRLVEFWVVAFCQFAAKLLLSTATCATHSALVL